MSIKTLLAGAAMVALAACTGKPAAETLLQGSFPSDAPESVEIIIGEALDTTVAVVDGTFSLVVPTDVTVRGRLEYPEEIASFIPDGTVLSFDPELKKFVSDKPRISVNERFNAEMAWEDEFMEMYQGGMNDIMQDDNLSEEEKGEQASEFFDAVIPDYNAHKAELVKANPDNFLGLMGISQYQFEDLSEMKPMLESLTGAMKENPVVVKMLQSIEAKRGTEEGTPFVDFTVVQDPENPEVSTVRLSDYVGKGKWILVDFWASWCGPCRREMPNLKEVYAKYHGDKFDMLSVAVWDDVADTVVAAEELEINWNQIVNAQKIPTDLYGIEGIPHIILFGPDGTIVKRGIRGEAIGEAVEAALAQ